MLDDPDQFDWQCPWCSTFNGLPSLGECVECGFDLVAAGYPDPHGLLMPRTVDVTMGGRLLPAWTK